MRTEVQREDKIKQSAIEAIVGSAPPRASRTTKQASTRTTAGHPGLSTERALPGASARSPGFGMLTDRFGVTWVIYVQAAYQG